LADGLRQVTLAGAGWAEKQGIFVARDEGASGQIEDQAAIHLLVESEVEVVESAIEIAETGFLSTPVQEPVGTPCEFIRYESGKQIDGRHRFGLGLVQPGFQHSCNSAEPELS
jgi:hypothetical protein